ncbi:MAG: endonuclease [Candidatus Muirbacterium halophilum]|nr:endonuclease [Candidatus Muirbacterium halophilum]MCK9475205.1 endonuclease [Candidatus Muirbacterium halophilum]
MKKQMLAIMCVIFLSMSVSSLQIDKMNGVYDVFKLDKLSNEFEFEDSIELLENLQKTKLYNNSARYSMRNEDRSGASEISFYYMNGREYASVTPPMSTKSFTYRVIENTKFYLEMQNVDNEDDVARIVLDKSSNDFDYNEIYAGLENEQGEDLYYSLHDLISNHKSIGYDNAKVEMFGNVDNDENGDIHCVYTNLVVHSKYPKNEIMNCEHTWPQSKLGNSSFAIKRGDLNHLFPTDSKSNSRRSNYPFGLVENPRWEQDGSKVGTSKTGKTVFEPRDDHKGNVARAMFYMGVRYRMEIDKEQEDAFREWNKLDPVDEKEVNRNGLIEDIQHARNPFIDNPGFVDRIDNF